METGSPVQPRIDANERVARLCGIPLHQWEHEDVLADMAAHIRTRGATEHICITNTESMYFARRKQAHREYIEQSRFSLCDGIGVVLAGRMNGQRIWRFNGPLLQMKACEYGAPLGWRHFFCGGAEGVADLLSTKLSEKVPGLNVAGTYCPPFRELTEAEEDAMVEAINAARPDILWVGLGLLKQEAWIAKFRDRIDVPWMVGVGAAFDYHAGLTNWAPAWIRRIGMEWLYRLMFEPRMFRRNVTSFIFLAEASIGGVFGKAPLIGRDRG